MKGLKIMLCGLGLILIAVFCCIAGPYGSYVAGLIFGILFLISGIALMVIGLFVNESLADLKSIKITTAATENKPAEKADGGPEKDEPVKAEPSKPEADKSETKKEKK